MKRTLSVFFLLIISLSLQAAGPSSALYQHYLLFSKEQTLSGAGWTMIVHDVTADLPLLSHNPHLALSPASTQKIITTASALLMLGNHYQYQTHLQHDGHITTEGVLHGNLYIQGSGDPSLGAEKMADSLSLYNLFAYYAEALCEAGIRQLKGDIYADAGRFDEELVSPKWLWEDIGNYYGAGACGLNVNENEYTVYFQAGPSEGAAATAISVAPANYGMELENQVKTGPRGSGDQVYIYGAPYVSQRLMKGTVPLGAQRFAVRGSLPDPPYYAAAALKAFLSDQHFLVEGDAMRSDQVQHKHATTRVPRTVVSTWHSPDLFELVYRTNHESINLYAEALLKTIGLESTGNGSSKTGLQAIKTFWADKGIDLAEARLVDGSGLSPLNRLTANQLSGILKHMAGEKQFPVFLNSLPLAGYSGTLARHFHGSSAEGVLRAKSGYLSNTIAYAGYTPMENGHMASFVIIVNDYQGSSAIMRQKILDLMNTIRSHK